MRFSDVCVSTALVALMSVFAASAAPLLGDCTADNSDTACEARAGINLGPGAAPYMAA